MSLSKAIVARLVRTGCLGASLMLTSEALGAVVVSGELVVAEVGAVAGPACGGGS
ncbi:hypothetical protein [Methylopila turkensis]|uniref:hypothetical protein n=1 Tax=Methylopila turkensis TaxID=1437816 RepID=UPI0022F2B6D9|nr:hypothetical protein [Methylopila turkensis]